MKNNINVSKLVYYFFSISLMAILFGSVSRLFQVYKSQEAHDASGFFSTFAPFSLAVGVEIAMFGISWILPRIKINKKDEGATKDFLGKSLWYFGFLNFFSQSYFSLANYAGVQVLEMGDIKHIDSLKIITTFVLSSTLPFTAIIMSRLQSLFYARWKADEEISLKEAEKVLKKKPTKIQVENTATVVTPEPVPSSPSDSTEDGPVEKKN